MMATAPLAVDLDGTLIHGDLFTAAMLRLARVHPWKAPLLALWLLRGRAYAKARLAARYPPDAAKLNYDARVVEWLRQERACGRAIVLATAYDERGAAAIAAHLGLFDQVFASNGEVNLKSHKKAARLQAAFPEGFVYAGNERADIAVWRAAKAAVLVNAPSWLVRRARRDFVVERVFPNTRN